MAKQFRIKRSEKPPIPFELTFEQVRRDDEGKLVLGPDGAAELVEVTEKFTARPTIPGALMMEIAGAASPGEQVAGMMRFLQRVVVEEDRERFSSLLRDSEPPIDAELLGEIAEWLVEEYGERPTG